jgi:hypothetical protein
MIVREDDPGAVVAQSIGDDLAEREFGLYLVALVAGNMEAPCLFIDMCDPEAFPARIGFGEAASEKLSRHREAIKFQRKFGTLIPHADLSMHGRRPGPLEPCPKWTAALD